MKAACATKMELSSLIDNVNVFNSFVGISTFDISHDFLKTKLWRQRIRQCGLIFMAGITTLEFFDIPKVGEEDSLFFAAMFKAHFAVFIVTELFFLLHMMQNRRKFFKIYQSWQTLKNLRVTKPSRLVLLSWLCFDAFWFLAVLMAVGIRAYVRIFVLLDDGWQVLRTVLVYLNGFFSFFLQHYLALLFCHYLLVIKIYIHNLNERLLNLQTKHMPSTACKQLFKVDGRYGILMQ